jgi:hypothetical protein
VQFSDEETYGGMTSARDVCSYLPARMGMGTAIKSGILFEDFEAHKPQPWSKIKLYDFANEFAAVYNSQTDSTIKK